MDNACPAVAGDVFVRFAAVAERAIVEPVQQTIWGRSPNMVRHNLRERLELRLALTQRRVRFMRARDISALDKDAAYPAPGVAQRLIDEVQYARLWLSVRCTT